MYGTARFSPSDTAFLVGESRRIGVNWTLGLQPAPCIACCAGTTRTV
jgi:hypothetical protein